MTTRGATVPSVGQTSDTPRTMSVREFLKGGYRERAGTVLVLSGGEVAGVWSPGMANVKVITPSTNGHVGGSVSAQARVATAPGPVTIPGSPTHITFRPAPKPSKRK